MTTISKTMQAAMAARAHAHTTGLLQDEWAAKLIAICPEGKSARAVFDEASTGLFSHNIVIRSKFFEQTLRKWQGWCANLVCISGGMDLHLLSMPEASSLNKYFLDLPNSLGLLRNSVAEIGGDLAALGIQFDEIDLNHLDEKLGAPCWLSDKENTLVLWEGASYYVEPSAIQSLLMYIGSSAKSIKLCFDCLSADGYLVDGKPINEGVARNLSFIEKMGEPWLGFVSPAQLSRWAEEAGFASITISDRAWIEAELTGVAKLAKGQMMFVCLEK